jgi:bacteriocin biosynthesis cyclodehydratase domain-containing protein
MSETESFSGPLRISDGLDFVLLSDDEVLVQFGSRSHPSELLRDADMTGLLAKLVGRLLEGPATLLQLQNEVGEPRAQDAASLVTHLLGRGFLSAAAQDPVEQYVQYALGGSSRLSEVSIALIGCGPIGARIADGLRQHGVRAIRLSDDRPAGENWRKFAPANWEIGADTGTAAEAVQRALGRSGMEVQCVPNHGNAGAVDDLVRGSDLTILAMEQPNIRLAHLVNRFAVRRRKPWLHVVIDGSFGIVGPLFEPPYSACYNDFRTLATAATPSTDMMNRYRRYVLSRGAPAFFPGLPAYVDIVAGYGILASVHSLLGRRTFASSRAMFINFEQMQIDVEDVLKLPRCPVCGHDRPLARPVVPGAPASSGSAA